MSNPTFAILDQAELQQLALNTSASGDSASAIAYLKEAVSRSDATATAHYLLGAEYAQITMYERAIGEMEAAIALDPGLHVARLQLGMLLLGANQAQRADEILQPLEVLGNEHALHQFGAGLRQLIGGDLPAAWRSLSDGVALNHANPPLNADMQRVILHIEQLQSAVTDPAAVAATPAPDAGAVPAAGEPQSDESQHIMLSAYTGLRH